MALIQVRVDQELKDKVTEIYDDIGLDLSTAIRLFLIKSVKTKGLPFEANNLGVEVEALRILRAIQKHSEEKGLSEMTLDEINEEIRLAREESRAREAKEQEANNKNQ